MNISNTILSLSYTLFMKMQARPLCSKALEYGIYLGLVDPRLEENYDKQEMTRMVACASACVRHSGRRRPRMSQV